MPRLPPLIRVLRQSLTPQTLAAPTRLAAIASTSRSVFSASTSSSSSLLSLSRPTTSPFSTILNLASTSFGHPVGGTQVRTLAYGNMYQPSQRKRKRKHGFLSRRKGGRLGRKTLARRWARGRRFLSH